MPYIADPRYADVDPTDNLASLMFVVFNTISGNNGKAGTDILVVDSNGTLIKDENNKEVILLGYFTGGPMPNGYNKPLAWKLRANQSYNGMTINNFFDVKALLESEYFAAKGAKLQFRAWETTVEAGDGKIADYYCEHDNSIKLTGTTVLTIGRVKRDGLTKDVVWSPVSFVKAQAIDERNIRLSFSETISQNNGLNNLFVAVRIVDTSNDYALVYSGSSPLQYGLGKGWSYQSGELVAYLNKDLSEIFAICDKLNADNATDKYKVMFCLEEIGSKLSYQHGEHVGNGYVDTLWGAVSKAPVSASHMPAKNTYDGVYCEVTPVSELKENCMTITSANVSSREGVADRIIVTFSEPISSVPVSSWVRIFDSNGTLVRHNKSTMQVVTTEDNHLQWKLPTWTKASADGKTWFADMNSAHGTNTIAGALNYAAKITDAAGKKVTLENGYKIQVAFLDANAGGITKINGNGLVKIEYLEENQTANFATNNPQLPLYDSAKGGYRLFNTKVNALSTKDKTDDACKYGFNVTFDNEEAYALFADVDHNDTTVSFKLETARLDESKKVVPLSEDAPTTYVNNKNAEPTKTWAFTLKITGMAALNGDALTVSGMIYSAGVTMDVEIPVS